jgi:two-component system, NarL family, nitrate/nitrite response regulator NarL
VSRHERAPEIAEDDIVRVLVADPSGPARTGLRIGLTDSGFEVCAEAGDARTAVAGAARERPDLCVVDSRLPGDAMGAVEQIATKGFVRNIVVLSDAPTDEEMFAALESGAAGYLPKDMSPARMGIALRAVLEGEAALPRNLVSKLIEEFRFRERVRGRRSPLLNRLTRRELEVLELLNEGLSTTEIARRLFVAAVTVRTHVASLVRKLELPDREAASRLLGNPRPDRRSSARRR